MFLRIPGLGSLGQLKRPGIGQRLLVQIILFSSLITLVATLIQLYTDYHRDVGTIKNRLDDIEGSYLGSISASLWNLDVQQLRLQLEGIHQLPDIQSVSVTESSDNVSDPLALSRGEGNSKNVITRHYPVIHLLASGPRQIGTLTVEASLSEVYARLQQKAVVILLSQGVKTGIAVHPVHRLPDDHLAPGSNF